MGKCFVTYLFDYVRDSLRALLSLCTTENAGHRLRQSSAIRKTSVQES